MKREDIELAWETLIELGSIEWYEDAIRIVTEHHTDDLMIYHDSISDHRMDTLHILIKADMLSTDQLYRILAVDNFILYKPIPVEFEMLKVWLKRNALEVLDPNAIPHVDDTRPRPELKSIEPARGRYTKKQLEFFKRRTEVYLSQWETAEIQDLYAFDWKDTRSIYFARSALQRVYWGNHLSDGQKFRLLHTDLRWYQHPEAKSLHPQYLKFIKELMELNGTYHYFTEHNTYVEETVTADATEIKEYLNRWDWVTETWDDEETCWDETEDALEARWNLHCAYKQGLLDQNSISELVEYDKAALLSPNYQLFSRFERKFIGSFLLEQGVFDPLPQKPFECMAEIFDSLLGEKIL